MLLPMINPRAHFRPFYLRMALAALPMMALLPACSPRCCDCSTSEIFTKNICEDNMPAGFTSWEACSGALEQGGCRCD